METKEFKIIPPEGYEIDKENSTFECIRFKPKHLTYKDIAKVLFENSPCYYTDIDGNVCDVESLPYTYAEPNIGTSQKQLEKLLAINKLMNVAKYLNGDWKPNWKDPSEEKFTIAIDGNDILIHSCLYRRIASIYFKSKQFAKQAVNILGKNTIYLALSTDW